jgi:HAD superfamily hydrolase (TIGR01509 family)
MIRALVFDFDGTIIDSETPVLDEWMATYAAHGHELPRDEYVKIVGSAEHVFDPHAHLEGLIGRALDRAALTAERQARHREIIYRSGTLPGVVQWLDAARTSALPLAIASSSQAWWVESNLDRLALRDRFRVVRTRETVRQTKPAPDLFLGAVEDLGVAPEHAIAIEDSPNGVRAAKAAGLFTIAVPNPVTRSLDLSAADIVIESLSALSLAEAMARATRRP